MLFRVAGFDSPSQDTSSLLSFLLLLDSQVRGITQFFCVFFFSRINSRILLSEPPIGCQPKIPHSPTPPVG